MYSCTFFGHRRISKELEPILKSTLINLIEENGVDTFYVGNNGQFDEAVQRVLRELSKTRSITYSIVISYMPGNIREFDTTIYSDTVLPEGIERVPKRFAIDFRNRYMIKNSDYVVTYVRNTIGSGASKYKRIAEEAGKRIIEL